MAGAGSNELELGDSAGGLITNRYLHVISVAIAIAVV